MTTHSIIALTSSPKLVSLPAVHSTADITIQNIDTAANVYIGGPDVSTLSYGYKLAANTAISFVLRGNDELYAISDSDPAGSSIAVLTLGAL